MKVAVTPRSGLSGCQLAEPSDPSAGCQNRGLLNGWLLCEGRCQTPKRAVRLPAGRAVRPVSRLSGRASLVQIALSCSAC